MHWISYDLCIWYHTEPTRYHIPYTMICIMISYHDIMYTYDMIWLVISYMISYHDLPVGSTPPSAAPGPRWNAKTCSLRTLKKKNYVSCLKWWCGDTNPGLPRIRANALPTDPTSIPRSSSWDDSNLTFLVYIYACQNRLWRETANPRPGFPGNPILKANLMQLLRCLCLPI